MKNCIKSYQTPMFACNLSSHSPVFSLLLVVYIIIIAIYIGPSAFNQWLYNLTLQSNDIATKDTGYQYSDLLPNTVYTINIFPSALGAVGNVSDAIMSSWIVQTVDNGQCSVLYCC